MICHEPHDEHDSSDASGVAMLIGSAGCAAVCGLFWVLLFLAIHWIRGLPSDEQLRLAATLGGIVALFAGIGVVAGSLAQMEVAVRPSPDRSRGRRPACAHTREGHSSPGGPPARADVAHGSTARPRPGGGPLRSGILP